MMFSKKNKSKAAKKKNNPLQSSLLRLFIFYTVVLLILPCVFTCLLYTSACDIDGFAVNLYLPAVLSIRAG